MYLNIQLLIAIIFHNISFGLTFKNGIISRVPEHCSDLAKVAINEVHTKCPDNSHVFYVVYANHTMYSLIEGLTRDGFPIVRLRNQPKKLDRTTKAYLKSCILVDDYVFDEYTYSLKNKSGIFFIGFNYLWLGCPQSICLSGNIDAATRLFNGTEYIFRGNYYWDIDSAPVVSKARKITDWINKSSSEIDFEYGYFNAIVTNQNFTSFYRNDRQFILDLGFIHQIPKQLIPNEFQYNMDSAFNVLNGSKRLTYNLKENQFITNNNPFNKIPIKYLGIHWDRVDAAFGRNQTIYLFKDSYYIKLAENTDLPVEPTLVFKELYNCSDSLYETFGGYNNFINKFIERKNRLNSSSDPNAKVWKTKVKHIQLKDHQKNSVIIAIVLSIIAMIVVLIGLRKKTFL